MKAYPTTPKSDLVNRRARIMVLMKTSSLPVYTEKYDQMVPLIVIFAKF